MCFYLLNGTCAAPSYSAKIAFLLQGVEIFQNNSGGVIMSDQSLVLQNVARATAGDYTCMATNVEGKGTSNPVKLVVRCECKVPFLGVLLLLSHRWSDAVFGGVMQFSVEFYTFMLGFRTN